MRDLDFLAPLDWVGLRTLRCPCLFQGTITKMVFSRLRGGQVYLATPYTEQVKTSGEFDEYRSEVAGALAARWLLRLNRADVAAVSSVVMAVAMLREDQERNLRPLDEGFWAAWCRPMLAASHAVAVPMVPGWDRSRGIWAEVMIALRANMAVALIEDQRLQEDEGDSDV